MVEKRGRGKFSVDLASGFSPVQGNDMNDRNDDYKLNNLASFSSNNA